jgi:type I restriction enzyme S subunit
MMDKASGTAGTMPKISGEILRNLPIPVPPPAEATEILRRISDALAACADTLTLLDAEAADAARLKQSILKAAFEGRLVPQDPADEPASALLRLAANPAVMSASRGRARKFAV